MSAPDEFRTLPHGDQFHLLKTLLRICGVSLYPNEKWSYKLYSAFILSLNLYPFFQYIGAHKYLEDGSEVFEFFIFQTVTTLIFIKAVVLLNKRRFMGEILERLQSEPFLPNSERGGVEEFVIKRDYIVLMDRQAIMYWAVVTITVVFALLDSIYWRIRSDDHHDWRFEYGRVTMFNTTYSPNYEVASFYQNLSWFPIGWTFATSDLLTVTVLAHITCQLKILQTFIRKMIKNSRNRMEQDVILGARAGTDASEIPWKYLRPTLKEAVTYHLAVFDIANKIEENFNLLVLLIVLSGIVLIGSLLYKLNGIILISYWGNEVTLASQNVRNACYEVEFYGADVRFQKGIVLIMERSKKPITFTAGKFSALTLGTFIWIARTSYSYLMILRRVNN
ncbi:uncharacterized protein LOC116172672 [Photinus pyralis]|uniref:uncharacterized protein LOC116172672 n=1 Tax=Photinus pyralis TaxID=7054 RepID=UPI0012675C89|nr:uncharacterized protein LOC116172672 [Photinus pyralis]